MRPRIDPLSDHRPCPDGWFRRTVWLIEHEGLVLYLLNNWRNSRVHMAWLTRDDPKWRRGKLTPR